jgi:hypothetical protein
MFWGEGLFVFPLMLLYTVISYSVFRGKVEPMSGHDEHVARNRPATPADRAFSSLAERRDR